MANKFKIGDLVTAAEHPKIKKKVVSVPAEDAKEKVYKLEWTESDGAGGVKTVGEVYAEGALNPA